MVDASEQTQNSETPSDLNSSTHAMDKDSRKRCMTSSVSEEDESGAFHFPSKKAYHRKQAWSREEDRILLDLIAANGPANWDALAKSLGYSRTGKQCRERYFNILDPSVKRGHWTLEEDHLIMELHKAIGKKWAEIAKYLGGRTDNSVKNRWHTLNNTTVISLSQNESKLTTTSTSTGIADSTDREDDRSGSSVNHSGSGEYSMSGNSFSVAGPL